MNEEFKGYPKFQWSIFVKNGKDQQFVIRAETIEEFKKAKSDVLALIGETVVNDGIPEVQVRAAATTPSTSGNIYGKCAKCGGWNKKSQTGNIYCGELCWKK